MRKILHISRDKKFLGFAINCFEQVNRGENYYMVLEKEKNPVSSKKFDSVHQYSLAEASELLSIEEFISKFSAVIFHGISPLEQRLLEIIPNPIKVIWFGYGFDYYPLIDFFMQRYLDKKTKKYWYQDKRGLVKIGLKINEYIPFWTFFKSRSQVKAFERVDYFAPVLKQEYLEIKSRHPEFRAEYVDWNYELGEEIFESIGEEFVSGTNFLIGNSASITNNHVDCFSLLTPQALGNSKVIVPLSYGFPKHFKKIINTEGRKRFGRQYEPLEEFVPFKEYLVGLRSCGFALFGSIRQQALGNIYMCLALGIKVYLHPQNPVLEELQVRGFYVFDFNQFTKETAFISSMPIEMQKENRELMRQMSLKENYLKKTRTLIEMIHAFG